MQPIILIPGHTGSGPDHWQTHWEKAYPSTRRVQQEDWDNPDLDAWIEALEASIESVPEMPLLAAHSLGCYLVAHWAERYDRPIAGALLVAPPDLDRTDVPLPLRGFAPAPRNPLPFPSILAASTDDPYASIPVSRALATEWGCAFESLGPAGRVNTASGFGSWPEGEHYLRRLITTPRRRRHRPANVSASSSFDF